MFVCIKLCLFQFVIDWIAKAGKFQNTLISHGYHRFTHINGMLEETDR